MKTRREGVCTKLLRIFDMNFMLCSSLVRASAGLSSLEMRQVVAMIPL